MTRSDAVLALSTFFLLASHAFEWDDSDSIPEVRFDDKPLRPIEALKLQRHSNPQWLFFVSSELVDSDNSTVLQEWDFVSHMIITPEQCHQIAEIIQMLDDALQRANPTVSNITSMAHKLGQEECDEDDQCPCDDADDEMHRRRVLISHRLLEVKTRSNAPGLKPPQEYPLRIASFSTQY